MSREVNQKFSYKSDLVLKFLDDRIAERDFHTRKLAEDGSKTIMIVDIPPKTDKRWREIVLGEYHIQPKLLALKLMICHLNYEVRNSKSEITMEKCINELYNVFHDNPRMVFEDVRRIFG